MGWIRDHITGDPAKVEALEAARAALEDYREPAETEEFDRLNTAVHEAGKDVPAAVRNRWI